MTPSTPTAQNAAAAQKQTCCCSEADLPLCRVAKRVEVLPAGVLDHGGRPAQEDEGIVPWRRQVRVGVGVGVGVRVRVRVRIEVGVGGLGLGFGLGFVVAWRRQMGRNHLSVDEAARVGPALGRAVQRVPGWG